MIPVAHREIASRLDESMPGCSVDFDEMPGGPVSAVGESRVIPVSIESFHLTKQRAGADSNAELGKDV